MPNINIDSGVKRRFRCYNHTSEFTSDKTKVDIAKNIYLMDLDVIDNIINYGLLNTWIDILSEYANKWIHGQEIPIPSSFQDATDEIIATNDNIQDFIDVNLTITKGGKSDRIGKNSMIELYKQMFPNRGMNHQILKSSLCERGISWDKEIRGKDGLKGCYTNVIKTNETLIEFDCDECNNSHVSELEKENKRLQLKLKELEKWKDQVVKSIPREDNYFEPDERYYELPDYLLLIEEEEEEEIIKPKPIKMKVKKVKKQKKEKKIIELRYDEVKKINVEVVDDTQLDDYELF
jgi:hypothetical protein